MRKLARWRWDMLGKEVELEERAGSEQAEEGKAT